MFAELRTADDLQDIARKVDLHGCHVQKLSALLHCLPMLHIYYAVIEE